MTAALLLLLPYSSARTELAPARPDADGTNLNWTDPAYEEQMSPEPIAISPKLAPNQRPTVNRPDLTLGVVAGVGASANPLFCDSRDLMSVLNLAYESLFTMGDNMEPVARLAESYEHNGKDWIVNLRKNVTFANGQPLTARDVIASYQAIRGNEASPYNAAVNMIVGMTYEDDYKISMRARDSYQLLYALMYPVVPQYEVNEAIPGGSGAYYVAQYQPGTRIMLYRNDNWWRREPSITSIQVYLYSSAENALNALNKAQIDGTISRSILAGKYRMFSSYSSIDYPTQQFECLIPNLNRSPLNDINVRKAIMHALDRTMLASTVYLNMVAESESPVSPSSWLYEAQTTKYRYNRDSALRYLALAGFNDDNMDGIIERSNVDFKFTLLTYDDPNSSTRTDMAMRIRDQLADFGIDVTVKTVSYANALDALIKGNFDMVLGSYYLDPVPDLSFLLAPNGKGNFARYKSEEMDGLLREARAEMDQTAFALIMSRIQLLAVEDLPIMGLYFRTGVLIMQGMLPGANGIRETQALRGLETYRK